MITRFQTFASIQRVVIGQLLFFCFFPLAHPTFFGKAFFFFPLLELLLLPFAISLHRYNHQQVKRLERILP